MAFEFVPYVHAAAKRDRASRYAKLAELAKALPIGSMYVITESEYLAFGTKTTLPHTALGRIRAHLSEMSKKDPYIDVKAKFRLDIDSGKVTNDIMIYHEADAETAAE